MGLGGTHGHRAGSKGGASFTKRLLLFWYKTAASKAKENVADLSPPAPVDLLTISKREGKGSVTAQTEHQFPEITAFSPPVSNSRIWLVLPIHRFASAVKPLQYLPSEALVKYATPLPSSTQLYNCHQPESPRLRGEAPPRTTPNLALPPAPSLLPPACPAPRYRGCGSSSVQRHGSSRASE